MTGNCACGQQSSTRRQNPVENPARKILDAMSLDSKNKTSYKSVTRSSTSGVREAVDELNQIVTSLIDALDLITARIDAIDAQINAPASESSGAGADSRPNQEVMNHEEA